MDSEPSRSVICTIGFDSSLAASIIMLLKQMASRTKRNENICQQFKRHKIQIFPNKSLDEFYWGIIITIYVTLL